MSASTPAAALAQADAIALEEVRHNPAAIAFVEFLNSDEKWFTYKGKRYTTKEVNAMAASGIKLGHIIEIPGDPYTYKLA